MNFVLGFPKKPIENDAIWMIVDRLTKYAHFLPIKIGQPVSKLAQLYIKKIIRLHGTPVSIVFDRDQRFTSQFWENL